MSGPTAESSRLAVARAADRCEYCRMHQSLQGATFHVEHIVPSAAGGSDDTDNLGLACPACNLKNSDRTTAIDPDTGRPVPLFHPRLQTWADHFARVGRQLVGRTPSGRATAELLGLNSPRRLRIREAEEASGLLFPPDERTGS